LQLSSAVIRHIIYNTDHNVDKLTYAGNLESVENNSKYAFEQIDNCNNI